MPKAQLVIVNGTVWRAGPAATAVAVSGDRIAAVGTDAEILQLASADARVVDASGGMVLPAFNDAHVHFLMASRSLTELDLHGAQTEAEVERRIKSYVQLHSGPWIVGRGWFYSAFRGGMPTVQMLDRLVPDRPAYLESFDAHTGWANTKALHLAGVEGAGVLKEAAMLAVTPHLPARSRAEDLDALRAGMRVAAEKGVASVQEAGDGLVQLPLWESLAGGPEMTVRVRLAFDLEPGMEQADRLRRLEELDGASRRWRAPWLCGGILKAFADGVVESRTAAFLKPYPGTEDRGDLLWEDEELALAVRMADARGWQVQVHAIGDAAIRQALDAFEGTTSGRRHRIEHLESPAAEDVARLERLGVVASMQPQHADDALTAAWRANLGPERAARGWPWRGVLDAGAPLAFGSDWPVVPIDPLAGLAMATGRGCVQDLSLDEAIAAWTAGSAFAEHTEGTKGQLRAGMLADVAVVDFKRSMVTATVVGGRLVYER